MIERYRVARGVVKYKGSVFLAGDIMPAEFTERDRTSSIYPRRYERVDEVPELNVHKSPPLTSPDTLPAVFAQEKKPEPPVVKASIVATPKVAVAKPTGVKPTGVKP